VEQRWDLSTDSKATFAPAWAGDLLKEMAGSNSFIAQTTPYGESPVTAIFDTSGLREALKPLMEVCGWSMDGG
jgi:type VI secretion system protein VasI